MERKDIIDNLKKGNCYGVDFYPKMDVPIAERVERIKHAPVVQYADLQNDTLKVKVNTKATEIHFIGQDGIVRHTALDTAIAAYKIKAEDTYIRTVFRFSDGTSVYLNPIIRHDGEHPVSLLTATINQSATITLRAIYFVITLTLVYFYRRRKQRQSADNI